MTGMSRLLFTKQKLLPMYVILFEHLKKKCKLWALTCQKEMGWSPEATDARLRKGISFVWTTA